MRHLVLLVLLISLFLVLARTRILSDPFWYDEADYMSAARMGLVANYTDSPTVPIVDFVRDGLNRVKSSAKRTELSESIRKSGDVGMYRHWHGPIYYYWLILASQFAHTEHDMRLWSLPFPIISLLILYFGCLWLTPGVTGQVQAVLASALFLWGATSIASTELAPHHAFACGFLLALILLAKVIITGERRYFYMAIAATAQAFGTLEMALILILVLIACGFIERRALQVDWQFCLRSASLFIGTVLVIWPGSILKLSFLKAYMSLAYLALLRKAPWGNITVLDAWIKRVMLSPLEWTLIFTAVAIYLINRQIRSHRMLYPMLIFAVLMMVATGRVAAEAPRYTLVFLPALDLFTACVLGYLIARRPVMQAYGSVAIVSLALYGVSVHTLGNWKLTEPPRAREMLASIQERHLAESTLLVPQEDVPTIHYYYPKANLRGYTGEASPAEMTGRKFDVILYRGYPVRLEAAN